jgi:hypothetical protein
MADGSMWVNRESAGEWRRGAAMGGLPSAVGESLRVVFTISEVVPALGGAFAVANR